MASESVASAVPAAQVIISIVPIVGIVMGSVVVFFFILWRHREIVRQIEAGTYRRPQFDVYLFSLLAGFLLSGTGFGLTILFLFVEGLSYTLLGGVIPLALGASLLGFYFVTRAEKRRLGSDN